MIIVVTNGEYSDFRIEGLVEVPEGRSWKEDSATLGGILEEGWAKRLRVFSDLLRSQTQPVDYKQHGKARRENWRQLCETFGLPGMGEVENVEQGTLILRWLQSLGYKPVPSIELWDNGEYREHRCGEADDVE